METCEEFGISEKAMAAYVSDNAANMVAVQTNHFPEESYQVGCTSHTFTLSVSTGLNRKKKKGKEFPEWVLELRSVIRKSKKIANHFNTSGSAINYLIAKQHEFEAKTIKRIDKFSITRWGGIYFVLESFQSKRIS